MADHDARGIANEFIEIANGEERVLTHLQLQKLIYLAHGWNLGIFGEPLVRDPILAWQYGPVVRSVYDVFRRFGSDPITTKAKRLCNSSFRDGKIQFDFEEIRANLTEHDAGLIAQVWKVYSPYEAFQLVEMTHSDDGPWKAAYESGNEIIDNESIKKYFAALNDA